MSDSNTRSVSPSSAAALITHCMRKNRAVFIHGSPGIGKSELIEQIGKNWDRPADLDPKEDNPNARLIIDMRLLLLDPTDLRGIPFFNSKTGLMEWAPSSELPAVVTKELVEAQELVVSSITEQLDLNAKDKKVDDYTKFERKSKLDGSLEEASIKLSRLTGAYKFQNAILFLDEMNSAPQSVQGAAYQLILNHRIGEYHLPKDVSIIAAGNKDSDKGVTFRMPTPLANRFVHFEMVHNFDDWQKWAINNKVHSDVVGYLTHHTHKLFQFDPKSGDKSFATPRSWVFVSELLDDSLSEAMNANLVAGTVGEGTSIEFMAHRRIAGKLPLPMDVLTGKVKKVEIEEISAKYSLAISICYKLKELQARLDDADDKEIGTEEWNNFIDTFFAFIMDNFESEMVVLAATTAVRDYQLPINHRELKNFKTFFEKYGRWILDK